MTNKLEMHLLFLHSYLYSYSYGISCGGTYVTDYLLSFSKRI